jgi:hypothetical protein
VKHFYFKHVTITLTLFCAASSLAQTAAEIRERAKASNAKTFGTDEAEKAGLAKAGEVHQKYSEAVGEAPAASPSDSSCGHELSASEIAHLRNVRSWVNQMLANPTPDNINSVTQTMTKAARELSKGNPAAESYLMQLQFREMLMQRNNMLNVITKKFVDNPQLLNETNLNAITALTTEEKNLLSSIGSASDVENPLGVVQKMARDRKDAYQLLEQRGAKVLKDGSWDFSGIDTSVFAKGGADKDALISAWSQFVPAIGGDHVSFAAGQDPKVDSTKKVADVIADPTRKGPLFLESSVILPHDSRKSGDFVPEVLTLEGYGQEVAGQLKVFESSFAAAQKALAQIDWKDFMTGNGDAFLNTYFGVKPDKDNPYGGSAAASPATAAFESARSNLMNVRANMVQRFGWSYSVADEKAVQKSKDEFQEASNAYYNGIFENLKIKRRIPPTQDFNSWFRQHWAKHKDKAPRLRPAAPQSPLASLDLQIASLDSALRVGLERADSELFWKQVQVIAAPLLAIGGAALASRGAVTAGQRLLSVGSKSGSLYGSTSSVAGFFGVAGSYGKLYAAGLGLEAATWLGSSGAQALAGGDNFWCVAWKKFEDNAAGALALNSVFSALGPIGERLGTAAKGSGFWARSAQGGRIGLMGAGLTAMGFGAKGAVQSMRRANSDGKTAEQYRAQGDFEMADAYQKAAGQHWSDVTSFVGAIGLSAVGMRALGKQGVSNAEAETHLRKTFGKNLGVELAAIVKNGYKTADMDQALKFTGKEGWVSDILGRLPKEALENADVRAKIFKSIAAMDQDALQFVSALEGPQFLKAFDDSSLRTASRELRALNGAHSGKASSLSPERAAKILSGFDDDGVKGLNDVLARANDMIKTAPSMNRDEAIRKSIEGLIRSRNVDPKHVLTDSEIAQMISCLR